MVWEAVEILTGTEFHSCVAEGGVTATEGQLLHEGLSRHDGLGLLE